MFCCNLVAKIMQTSSALFIKTISVFFDGLNHCHSIEFIDLKCFFCLSGFVESQNVWLFVGDLELDNESSFFPKIRDYFAICE